MLRVPCVYHAPNMRHAVVTQTRACSPPRAHSALAERNMMVQGAARRFFFMRCRCAPCTTHALHERAPTRVPSCRAPVADCRRYNPVAPRPCDVLDPMPDRLCSAPRWFIDHWAYCVLGVDRSRWHANLPHNTMEVIEQAYITPDWWTAHPWPGTWLPLRTPDRTRRLCGSCLEFERASCGAVCITCEEFTCAACLGARCSGCGEMACVTCADQNWLTCYWCNASVCSGCTQDWLDRAAQREDEGHEDAEYVCEACN
jgi:hypothetical protein